MGTSASGRKRLGTSRLVKMWMWQLYMTVGFCWTFCDDRFVYVKFRENNDVVDFFVGLECFVF